MKKEIRKGPILYKGMARGRRKFLIINIFVTLLYVLYISNSMTYIVGKLHGPYDFDSKRFLEKTADTVIYEPIEMKIREDRSIRMYADFSNSYFDGDKYRFSVKFDSFEETGVKYTTQIENPETRVMEDVVLYTVYMGKIGNRNIPVMCIGDRVPDVNVPLDGIFTEPAKVIVSDLSKDASDQSPLVINQYIFDSRNIEMGIENTDVWIMFIGFALLLFLYIRVIRYYIDPYKHPTYKQLAKYGDLEEVINDIEDQFESPDVYVDGDELICTDWIMVKSTFKNKILKNHRTSGRYS